MSLQNPRQRGSTQKSNCSSDGKMRIILCRHKKICTLQKPRQRGSTKSNFVAAGLLNAYFVVTKFNLQEAKTTLLHKSRIAAATAKCLLCCHKHVHFAEAETWQHKVQLWQRLPNAHENVHFAEAETKWQHKSRIVETTAKCLLCRHKSEPSRSRDTNSNCSNDC